MNKVIEELVKYIRKEMRYAVDTEHGERTIRTSLTKAYEAGQVEMIDAVKTLSAPPYGDSWMNGWIAAKEEILKLLKAKTDI